ncbi:MAG: hypothetical protein A2V93_02660 [Ignavibacteria bacterium RBG_16_34_14]|nr:MAG: hypothetical protein A2V93_02660 [Ignavibacteria bacterium RBG_16_34_14]
MHNTNSIEILMIIFLSIFWGCSGSERVWKETQQKDTIEEYEKYLNNYPDNEYSTMAENRIQELKQELALKEAEEKRRREEMIKEDTKRLQRLKEYKENVTTEKEFLDDRWAGEFLFYKLTGVLSAGWNSKSSEYVIGYLNLDKVNVKAAEYLKSDYEVAFGFRTEGIVEYSPSFNGYKSDIEINKGIKKSSDGYVNSVKQKTGVSHVEISQDINRISDNKGNTVSVTVRSKYSIDQKNKQIVNEICKLIFDQGILKRIEWQGKK